MAKSNVLLDPYDVIAAGSSVIVDGWPYILQSRDYREYMTGRKSNLSHFYLTDPIQLEEVVMSEYVDAVVNIYCNITATNNYTIELQ